MHLGALLKQIQEQNDIPALLESVGDILLLEKVKDLAAAFDETPVEYVAAAVQRYAARADSDEWLRLMTAMEKADEPAKAALTNMVTWAMSEDQKELTHDHAHAQQNCGCGRHEQH